MTTLADPPSASPAAAEALRRLGSAADRHHRRVPPPLAATVMLRVLWTPPAERDLRRLASKVQQRIVDALDRFATTRAGNVCRLAATADPACLSLERILLRGLRTQDCAPQCDA
jgi:hypothetical protein